VDLVDRYLNLGAPTYTLMSKGNAPDEDLSGHPISHRVGQIRNHFSWA
jgi:hypothetical protein